MPENENKVFRTVKRTVRSSDPGGPEKEFYGVNLITSSAKFSAESGRLMTPLEAEKRRSQLLTGAHSGVSSIRKMRKATRKLSLKPAPKIPTAPSDPRAIRRRFFLTQAKAHVERIDKQLLLALAALALIGLAAVFSATHSYQNASRYLIIQSAVTVVGFAAVAVMSLFDYRAFAKKYRVIILINAALLLFTYFFGTGVTGETNANWIDLGIIKLQPSEFAKILFIYAFAVHLYVVRDRINKVFTAATVFLHALLILGLTFLQKDLGTLTIFIFITAVMCFTGGLNLWYFLTAAVGAVAASPLIWDKLGEFQRQRILVIFDPSIDPNAVDIRHQTARSLAAISLGGLRGSGYLHGEVTQGNFFAKHTDMIYSTICEEFGFFGGAALLALYAFFIVKIILIARSCDNPLGCLICTGVAAMFIIQIIENIGMCLGVMPVIGITLPFISYGGSSALSAYLGLGLVFSVCTHKDRSFFA